MARGAKQEAPRPARGKRGGSKGGRHPEQDAAQNAYWRYFRLKVMAAAEREMTPWR
jgi:hypothetical protein